MAAIASGGRYPVLRALAIINLLIAFFVLVVGLFSAWWAVWGSVPIWWYFALPETNSARYMLGLMVAGGTVLGFIGMLAVSEVLKLMIDVGSSLRTIVRLEVQSLADSGKSLKATDLQDESAELALFRGR